MDYMVLALSVHGGQSIREPLIETSGRGHTGISMNVSLPRVHLGGGLRLSPLVINTPYCYAAMPQLDLLLQQPETGRLHECLRGNRPLFWRGLAKSQHQTRDMSVYRDCHNSSTVFRPRLIHSIHVTTFFDEGSRYVTQFVEKLLIIVIVS